MNPVIIRPFTIVDYDNVIALWHEAGLHYRATGRDSRRRIEKEIQQNTCLFLVAITGGRVIGTLLATQDGRKGWLHRLAVAKDYRRQKIAQKLIAAAENHFTNLGIDVIACLIEPGNAASQAFFGNSGYEKSDILYYSKRKNAGS
ncbi:MAG: GNAT family N-acetyltransferase [Dehalococcoidales bacterium]|nr:GNAT family N-acetyltransferase [Dehalococcoidales bacterium]